MVIEQYTLQMLDNPHPPSYHTYPFHCPPSALPFLLLLSFYIVLLDRDQSGATATGRLLLFSWSCLWRTSMEGLSKWGECWDHSYWGMHMQNKPVSVMNHLSLCCNLESFRVKNVCKIFLMKNLVLYDSFACVQLLTTCVEIFHVFNFCTFWRIWKFINNKNFLIYGVGWLLRIYM